MKQWIKSALLLAVVSVSLADAQINTPLKVLFIGKAETHHDSPARYNDFKGPMTNVGIQVDYTEDFSTITDAGLKPYDAVLMYTMHGDWGKGGEVSAVKRFVEGGKGLVGVHTATVIWGNEEWINLIGAHFENHNYGDPILIDVPLPNHEAIKGVPTSIPAWDETYFFWEGKNAPDRVILQTRKQMKDARPDAWTWVRNQGKGRVYYTAAGHDAPWRTAEFQKQLEVALRWSAANAIPTNLNRQAANSSDKTPTLLLSQDGRLSLSSPVAGRGIVKIFGMDARLITERSVTESGMSGPVLRLNPGTYGYMLGIEGRTTSRSFSIPQ